MDFQSFCLYCAADVIILGGLYALYRSKVNCLESLQEAKYLEINDELPQSINSLGGIVPYAAISGHVKALTTPLKSHYYSHLRGVMYTRVITEKKLEWQPKLQSWEPFSRTVHSYATSVSFGLHGGNTSKKQLVEVMRPWSADELHLSTVHNKSVNCYQLPKETFRDYLLGVLRGKRTVAVVDVEKMLLEDTSMTAVGTLVLENDKLKIMPPADGSSYFLAPLSFNSLKNRIKGYADFYKTLAILLGVANLALFLYLLREFYRELKNSRELKRREEVRTLRRMADTLRHFKLEQDLPKCVICLENPIEVIILDCGHVCLCIDCEEHCQASCPMCRGKIQRLVPAILPHLK